MTNIFVSYSRPSEAIARTLADDIEALGHTVWFDQELSGGQPWWDQILAKVRDCDVFVFVMDPEALKSTACKREYDYAGNLGKPILPVLVSGDVSTRLLPPALSKIQFVDYLTQDRDAAFRLARAFTSIPSCEPLPDPLPPPPDTPISYLGTLTERVETTSALSFEEQSALVVDLRRSLRTPETADDARTLLEGLRNRRDLLAAIAEEIDELLTTTIKASPANPGSRISQFAKKTFVKTLPGTGGEPLAPGTTEPPSTQRAQTATSVTMTPRGRLICAVVGACLGTVFGVAMMATSREGWELGLIPGAGLAIAGAISGVNRVLIVAALIGAVLGWFTVSSLDYTTEQVIAGAILGAPPGAILGAIAGVIFRKLAKLF